ncbi:MAG: hypothetical protein KC503_11940 [Myxococcales bacterium]|nr:hypothetical protein [Myxococcales bacterium]
MRPSITHRKRVVAASLLLSALLLAAAACSDSDSAAPPADASPGADLGGDATPDLARRDAARPDGPAPDLLPPGPYVVDPSTLDRKVMFGYQGWFACPGDGVVDRWRHWFGGQTSSATEATFDAWPDLGELTPAERCPTDMQRKGGGAAYLFSSARRPTVLRHFKWMADHDLDGVFLQRFVSELGDPTALAMRDAVTGHVRAGAETHGRVFALMYDVSGAGEAGLFDALKSDWAHLVDDLGVTQSARYLRHGGRPVLGLWGLGFPSRPGTPALAQTIIDWFRKDAPQRLRATLVGGVPHHWRTRDGDAKPEPAWDSVYRSYDVVSPWAVGAFVDDAGADVFRKDRIEPDMAALAGGSASYMPVVFPGFSWANLMSGSPLNQIPRRGGRFYWHQVFNVIDAGVTMIYVAMFDEVDEGTAMFKIAPTQADVPTSGSWLTLDADGQSLPSDFYLRLGRATGRTLRGQLRLERTLPQNP